MDADRLSAVCRTDGIRLLLQFGSTVSGRTHATSDVDLAVLLERRPASLDAHAERVGDLQALLPGREVDVALINEVSVIRSGGQHPRGGYVGESDASAHRRTGSGLPFPFL